MSYFKENIENLSGYTPGFQPTDEDVVKVNTNENPYPPSPKVAQLLAGFDVNRLRRYPAPLGDSFRVAAAKLNGLLPENIMCTNGGDDLLTIVLRSFCCGTRSLVYPAPTYSLYEVLAKIQNCPTVEIPWKDGYCLPKQELLDAGGALTIVCNPNAPSGSFIDPEEISELASLLEGKSVLLVDEAYADFAEGNCAGLVNKHENLIILRSMSKGYSLAGLRFGYAIACRELIDGLLKVKDSYNVDALAIAIATEAIQDQAYFKRNVELVKEQRTRVTKELESLGFRVGTSNANFVLAQTLSSDASDVFEKLKEKQVFVRYFPYDGLRDKLRITIGTPSENDKLIEALKEILSS